MLKAIARVGLALAMLPTTAHAQLAIDRLWVDFDSSGVPRSDLVVRNESQDRYYVEVTTSEVTNPGTDAEQRVQNADPEKLGLLVTPNRLILDPGQMRAIRVVSLNKDLKSDRVYRVSVTPKIGEISADSSSTANRGLAIKLLAAFDVLVTVRPKDEVRELTARRDGPFLVLSDEGNSNILLLDGKICPPKGEALSLATQSYIRQQDDAAATEAKARAEAATKDKPKAAQAKPAEDASEAPPARVFPIDGCVSVPGRRLYAGNDWRLPANEDEILSFNRRDSASQDLEPITIRCKTNDPSNNSKTCSGVGLETSKAKS